MKLSVAFLVQCVLFSLFLVGSSSATNDTSNQHLRSVTAVSSSEDVAYAHDHATVLGHDQRKLKKKAKGTGTKKPKAPKRTKMPKASKNGKKVSKSANGMATASPTAAQMTSPQPSPQPSSPRPSPQPSTDECAAAGINTQKDALLALKAGFTTADTLSDWVEITDPCNDSWTGVTCTDGEVTQINIANKSLEGTISRLVACPTTLYSSLSFLSFTGNGNLSGPIPAKLGQLTGLTLLAFSNNSFSGTIPTELGALTSLVGLYFSGNVLTGSMPTEICNLRDNANGAIASLWSDYCPPTEVVCTCCTHSCG